MSDQTKQNWTQWLEQPLFILAVTTSLTAILLNFEFGFLESRLYDLRVTHGYQAKPSPDITLITLDDATTKELSEYAPLPLNYHAELMERLAQYSPKAVGYLVDMNSVNQVNPELFQGTWGKRFIEAAHELETRGIPVILGTPYDISGEILPPYPLSALNHAVAVIHQDGNVFSGDKVTRRGLTYLFGKPTFHTLLPQKAGLIPNNHIPSGSFFVPEIEGQYFFFRYHRSTVLTFKNGGELPYQQISFYDLLKGNVPENALKGKTLLVGTISRENPSDFALTPYSKLSYVNPELVIHANILDSIVRDDGVVIAPTWINWLITFICIGIVTTCVMLTTPLYGVVATICLALGFMLLGHLLFQGIGSMNPIWIKESQPLVGILLGYYLVVPYRLIQEYKKRWDYQRKNKLLRQVEELKTNFLSLVTHDLKTPVARIQGLAEVLLNADNSEQETEKNLRHIIGSTEELNHFISSILELAKIESNYLKLNLESKDINQLIEKSLQRLQGITRTRGITFNKKLEPLFPIRIDPSLISKVINNLVDNAIKYSPDHSQILIESNEQEPWVEVRISDQGIGMTDEELQNLFTKFYRAKNDTTTKLSGTGLGLYLTKFFVEAHQGQVEVKSEQGKGSTFIIRLPLNLKQEAALPIVPVQASGLKTDLLENLEEKIKRNRKDKKA